MIHRGDAEFGPENAFWFFRRSVRLSIAEGAEVGPRLAARLNLGFLGRQTV